MSDNDEDIFTTQRVKKGKRLLCGFPAYTNADKLNQCRCSM